MNKLILVPVLLVALSGLIEASGNDLETCKQVYLKRAAEIEVPQRIQEVAKIVRSYEPSNPSLSSILIESDIDTSDFYKDESDLLQLQQIAMDFLRGFEILIDDHCMDNENFLDYLENLEDDSSDPNQAKIKELTDYNGLAGLILTIQD